MPTSAVPYPFACPIFYLFLPTDTLFTGTSLPTVRPPPHSTTLDHGVSGPPAHVLVLVPHHQKPPGWFRPSILHRNAQPDVHTFLPVSSFAPVAKNQSFCSWNLKRWGAAVTSSKGKETKQRGETSTYYQCGLTWQAPAQRGWRAVLFVLASAFVSLEENVLILWLFISYYINPNHKLTYLLPIPFNFSAADPQQSRLKQSLEVCYNSHWDRRHRSCQRSDTTLWWQMFRAITRKVCSLHKSLEKWCLFWSNVLQDIAEIADSVKHRFQTVDEAAATVEAAAL